MTQKRSGRPRGTRSAQLKKCTFASAGVHFSLTLTRRYDIIIAWDESKHSRDEDGKFTSTGDIKKHLEKDIDTLKNECAVELLTKESEIINPPDEL